MNKSKNLGGFITIPIPAPNKFPMTFDTYKREYGVDLMDILTDDPDEASLSRLKVNKPILTEDVDGYIFWIPRIVPAVTSVADDVSQLQIIHGFYPNAGIYMQIDWANKTLSGAEF